MLCPGCGAEWSDEVRFCGVCGARMPDATLVLPVSPQSASEALAASAPTPPTSPAPPPAHLKPALKSTQRVALDALAVADAVEQTAPATVAQPALAPGGDAGRDTVIPAPAKHLVGVLGEAWDLCAGRRMLLAGGTLILLAASVALGATVVGLVACGPLWGGLAIVGLRAGSGRTVVLDDFFAGVRRFVPLAVLGAIVVPAVILGLALLVLPGLYLAIAFMYAPMLVVDQQVPPREALGRSRLAVHEAFEAHAGLGVVLACVNVLGAALGGGACSSRCRSRPWR